MRLTHPRPPQGARPGSFLARLLRDRKANTLVIMAIALIPISGLAGSAVDMARLYVVKSRLQQACDAGVLAGRKYMTVGQGTLDANATARATEFFRNNMQDGWLDTSRSSFTPTKTSDNQVAATAQVVVPMTIMKMFAVADSTVKVSCQARYDVADTDIIFVLDTTGSMACRPEDNSTQCNNYVGANAATSYTRPTTDPNAVAGYLGSTAYAVPETTAGNGSRIKALRQAVKDFYATMASSKDANTRVRYGFVTYTSTINAGRAIMDMSPNYIVGGRPNELAPYQTRKVTGEYEVSSSTGTNGKSRANCTAATRDPAATSEQPYTFNTNRRATVVTESWSSSRCNVTTKTMGPVWTYRQWDLPVSDYVTRASSRDPTKLNGATTSWDGCVEERATEAGRYTFGSASYDLDPDLIPSTADDDTRWKPMWPDAIYLRANSGATRDRNDETDANPMGTADYKDSGFISCGKPIQRLTEMTSAQVAAYVDATDFRPIGGTYHDTGMIWGTRLLSTTGIFASDNTGRAGQAKPKKVIVFLTDGDMAPSTAIYGLYGYENYDKRVTGGDFGPIKAYHNARFLAECDRARTAGVDVWTVAIGLASTTELKACARTETQALSTTSGNGLSTAFQTIAKQVAMLRLQQ